MSRDPFRFRPIRAIGLWVPLLAAAGCAQPGPLLSQRTTVGTLKASVSRLEYENQQMQTRIKGLQADNRGLEDRLVQEESHNGELSARLDDARNVLSRRGFESDRDAAFDPVRIDAERPPARTLPAGRSNSPARKPPFARIPGIVDPAPPPSRPLDRDSGLDPFPESPSARSRWRGEEPPQSSQRDTRVWLPIAVGTSDPSETRR